MILRRMWEGAVKCALRFFRRDEDTLAFSFMAVYCTLGYKGVQRLATLPTVGSTVGSAIEP